jgi:hypothetical protein
MPNKINDVKDLSEKTLITSIAISSALSKIVKNSKKTENN